MDVFHVLCWWLIFGCVWHIIYDHGLSFYGFGSYDYGCGSCFMIVVLMFMDVIYIRSGFVHIM